MSEAENLSKDIIEANSPVQLQLTLRSILENPELRMLYMANMQSIETSPEYNMTPIQRDQYSRFMTMLHVLYKEIFEDKDHFVYDEIITGKDDYRKETKTLHPKAKLVELITKMEAEINKMLSSSKTKEDSDKNQADALDALAKLGRRMVEKGQDVELTAKVSRSSVLDVEAEDAE